MSGVVVRRISLLVAAMGFAAALTLAPVAAGASGLIVAPEPVVQATPVLNFKPDLAVSDDGVTTDANGNIYFLFKVKNIGLGLGKDVTVTKVYETEDIAYPHKLREKTAVLHYDTWTAQMEKPFTILCEKNGSYTCVHAYVKVTVGNPEVSTANNFDILVP